MGTRTLRPPFTKKKTKKNDELAHRKQATTLHNTTLFDCFSYVQHRLQCGERQLHNHLMSSRACHGCDRTHHGRAVSRENFKENNPPKKTVASQNVTDHHEMERMKSDSMLLNSGSTSAATIEQM